MGICSWHVLDFFRTFGCLDWTPSFAVIIFAAKATVFDDPKYIDLRMEFPPCGKRWTVRPGCCLPWDGTRYDGHYHGWKRQARRDDSSQDNNDFPTPSLPS